MNPLAGGGRTGAYLLRIQELFERQEIHADFIVTEDAAGLETRARAVVGSGHKFLLAMGGDGTFQGLVNATYGCDVRLGVLPTGGGNDFARALGLPRDPVAAAKAVINGAPRAVDLLRIRTADGRERLCTGGGGVGVDVIAAQHAAGSDGGRRSTARCGGRQRDGVVPGIRRGARRVGDGEVLRFA